MKNIFATITFLTFVNFISQSAAAKTVNIEFPNDKVKISLDILASKKNADIKKIFFEGLTECPSNTLKKCLKFHTQFPLQEWSYVPVELLTDFKPTLVYKYLEEIPAISQDRKETFKWGTVFNWSTKTKGTVHYFYLKPKSKTHAVMIGPIASTVLINFDLNLENLRWY